MENFGSIEINLTSKSLPNALQTHANTEYWDSWPEFQNSLQ
jgi:hypothetical protein